MIKKIREWLDKRAEKKLLSWIATHDIKYEKYKYFFNYPFVNNIEEYLKADITSIDYNIEMFISEENGQLIYAYDKDAYQKVKELKKQKISYCFTENEYETKLNYLIEKKIPTNTIWDEDGTFIEYDYFRRSYEYVMDINNKRDLLRYLEPYQGIKYLWVGSDTLEKDIKYCKQHKQQYKFTIQKELVKVARKNKKNIEKLFIKRLKQYVKNGEILLYRGDIRLRQKIDFLENQYIKNCIKRKYFTNYCIVDNKKYLKLNKKRLILKNKQYKLLSI